MPAFRQPAERLRAGALDLRDHLRGGRQPLVPPRRLSAEVGSGDFAEVGRDFFELFRRAGLAAGDDVLDVGCGAGRMARPLAGWLQGRYEGFDVQARAISWCERNYGAHPNFHFLHVDVANDAYNAGGRAEAAGLSFPYPDQSFDFAIVTSVFTHMMGDAVHRYLGELARVVRPAGTVFATWLLLDREVETALAETRTALELPEHGLDPSLGSVRLASRETPSAAIAFDLDAVAAAYVSAGFGLAEHWPGGWAGRARAPTWQDVLTAVRA